MVLGAKIDGSGFTAYLNEFGVHSHLHTDGYNSTIIEGGACHPNEGDRGFGTLLFKLPTNHAIGESTELTIYFNSRATLDKLTHALDQIRAAW